MRPATLALLLALAGACADDAAAPPATAAHADPHVRLAEQLCESYEDYCRVLEGIDSRRAADAAAADIDRIAQEFARQEAEAKKLGEPSPEQNAEMDRLFRDRMGAILQRQFQSMARAMPHINASPECSAAFERLQKQITPSVD